MRTVDPETQCEIIEKPRLRGLTATMLLMMSMYGGMPEISGFSRKTVPPWYYMGLSKTERRGLSYDEQQELKRYRYTLKEIRDRDIWPGMVL